MAAEAVSKTTESKKEVKSVENAKVTASDSENVGSEVETSSVADSTAESTAESVGTRMARIKINQAQLKLSLKTMQTIVQKKASQTNALFDNVEWIELRGDLADIPTHCKKFHTTVADLPHQIWDEKCEVLFVCKKDQAKWKQKLLVENNIPGLTKVMDLDNLRRKYSTSEARRALGDAFDLFLFDRSIAEFIHEALGEEIIWRRCKAPTPVCVRHCDPVKNIITAIKGLHLKIPIGPCVCAKIGKVDWSVDALAENALAVIKGWMELLREIPLMGIYVKARDLPCLPAWKRNLKITPIDFRKYRAEKSSSAPSETGDSRASEMEGVSEVEAARSETGDVPSTRETVSEQETGDDAETVSVSNADSESADVDTESGNESKKSKKRKAAEAVAAALTEAKEDQEEPVKEKKKKDKKNKKAEEAAPEEEAKAEEESMPPPAMKKKKKKVVEAAEEEKKVEEAAMPPPAMKKKKKSTTADA